MRSSPKAFTHVSASSASAEKHSTPSEASSVRASNDNRCMSSLMTEPACPNLPRPLHTSRDGSRLARPEALPLPLPRQEIELLAARDRAVGERLLAPAGRLHHVVAHQVEHAPHVEIGRA